MLVCIFSRNLQGIAVNSLNIAVTCVLSMHVSHWYSRHVYAHVQAHIFLNIKQKWLLLHALLFI